MNDARKERLMPNGIPRYIRCYDNGESIDHYTVVFTGRIPGKPSRHCFWIGMNGFPFHPQGFCQHGEHATMIDQPTYGHLGKKIRFQDLPADCQKVVIDDYMALWEIKE